MTDDQGLLAAIRAEPHDDTPRLVYADWLDENGHDPHAAATAEGGSGVACGSSAARAEFIRLQIEAAALRWDDPRWESLGPRVEELLRAHAAEWAAPFGSLVAAENTFVSSGRNVGGESVAAGVTEMDNGYGVEFERGFLRRLHVDSADLERLPSGLPLVGPPVQAIVRWSADPEVVWAGMRRALLTLPLADWRSGTPSSTTCNGCRTSPPTRRSPPARSG